MKKKPEITGTRYVLAVKDLAKSAQFYEEQLGFKTHWHIGGWQQLCRDKLIVMLGECPDDRSAFETLNHSYFAYIDVENIDDLYEEYRLKDIEMLSVPEDKLWGQREFGIRTIDGHRIMFGQPVDENE
jgi:catechol 2,3-dioxygenase-like lactoylglutathione lyase family enzyme